ncbi:IS3 family transposase [Streptococcus mutans]
MTNYIFYYNNKRIKTIIKDSVLCYRTKSFQ